MRYSPKPRPPLCICLLPEHPLIVTTIDLLRNNLSLRSVALLDRTCQGATSSSRALSPLYLSPHAIEALIDVALELKAACLLPSLTRELSRTHSTQPSHNNNTIPSPMTLRLAVVYDKLIDAHHQLGDPGSVLAVYSSANRALVPCSQIMYKRAIQALFKRFIPSSKPDERRYSLPRKTHPPHQEGYLHRPQPNDYPPVGVIIEQLRRILNHMASQNVVPNMRLLADVFRGLGSILKLETYGIEVDHSHLAEQDATLEALRIPAPKDSTPRFRLEHLVLDEEIWASVGKIVNNILAQTVNPTSFQRPGNEGRVMILMAWADVMLSLREDIADAMVRATNTKSRLNALSTRVNTLLATDQPWNYQRTFDRLAHSSSLRPHHENSFGEIGSETDPALDLPVGPAPGQWPLLRTLNEAQRISLLVRDRLVEGDSVAALLQFHSLASLCGAFRRLCDTINPADAPSLYIHDPESDVKRPSEVVLAEARQELEARVESVYVRLAGHALRTGDPSYVNDVLELAYTLPPRHNKLTFSRVWKRAMTAFVKWRAEWYGSGGVGRAMRTLAQLLGIGLRKSSTQDPRTRAVDRAVPKSILNTGPNREIFDLAWLREQDQWPALGRHVFTRRHVVSALIAKAEETTPAHLRPGAKPDPKTAAKHLQDAQRAFEEAEVRKTMRWLRENHPRYMLRPGEPSPSIAELDAQARAEAHAQRIYGKRHDLTGARSGGNEMINDRARDVPSGATPISMLVDVFGALSVPMADDEAQRLRYHGPTHEGGPPQTKK